MSNTLYISVGTFKTLDERDEQILVLAGDSYGNDVLYFDDVTHLKTCYPTRNDLIEAIKDLPAFEGIRESDVAVIMYGYPE